MVNNGVSASTTVVKVRFVETLEMQRSMAFRFGEIIILLFLGCNMQVDSSRKHGILLEAVQILTDLNLSIKKAYISSDGRWFMDGKKN